MTPRFHLFPFRTQKLSLVVPKILGWRRPGKIGRCRLFSLITARWSSGQDGGLSRRKREFDSPTGHQKKGRRNRGPYAPLAQLVEQLTLNQRAQGSSPWKCTIEIKHEQGREQNLWSCALKAPVTPAPRRYLPQGSYDIFLLSSAGRACGC